MSTLLVKTEINESRRSFDKLKTLALAEAGFERTVHHLRNAIKKTAFIDPLLGVKALLDDGMGGYKTYTPFTNEAVMDGANKIGEFSISITAADRDDGLDVEITSIGYFPASAANLPAGSPAPTKRTIKATIRLETKPSSVFDYAYFINNWGWFYGNTIFANGNARSNGQFDVAGYAPTVTGQPMYDDIVWKSGKVDLLGYRDDNNDGKMDGLDGGIFSGWDIVNAKNVKGEGGKAKNQHDFEENIPMPNLTNLDQYEKIAIDEDGEIRVGNMKIFEGVLGDDPGEKQNLFLIGTTSKPIKIDGTVVVRGDVIIAGVVTGEGAIYSGGNIYVPNDITYKNGPLAARPKDNTELETEVWLQANQNKDILGLFATENIVVGDVTNSTWRFYVSSWLSNPMNASEEDAGADQIPNTKKG